MDGTVVTGLFTGRSQARWAGRPPSAIGKRPADGPRRVTFTGIEGDEQADLAVHGGPEKAIHHYPAESYPFWHEEYGSDALHLAPGSFGENVSTEGWTEDDLCIGDELSMGTARVQVCQGRQPCWKLVAHTGLETLAYRFRATARTGWYYRVIEEGQVAAGDRLALLDRPHDGWTVRRVTRALFDPRLDPGEARALARLAALADGWRKAFAERAGAP
jgi:MOSC domain-containing protein YiiM